MLYFNYRIHDKGLVLLKKCFLNYISTKTPTKQISAPRCGGLLLGLTSHELNYDNRLL